MKTFPITQTLKFLIKPNLFSRLEAFLHASGIIHRDLKPDNLLVVSLDEHARVNVQISGKTRCNLVEFNRILTIVDFGTSKARSDQTSNMTKGIGTPIYMAPEVLGVILWLWLLLL